MDENVYFAAKEPEKTAAILLDKASSFYDTMRTNSYIEKLRRMWEAYNGIFGSQSVDGHQVTFVGEQGELVQLPVNHFRNLAQHMYVMITANRPIMEARAVNTDYKSLAQTYLANGILDYYMREKHLEDALKRAVEMSIVLGTGYIKMEWNATAGELYDFDPESGEKNYEGELEFENLSPLDVVFDGTKESWNHDWLLVRSFQNKFDLAAKYPELKEQILGVASKTDRAVHRLSLFSNDETDDIPVFEFYHKRTEALPDGRYMLFVQDDIVLLDTQLPYRTMPIFRISPSDIMGTPYGYSPMFDIYPIQENINALYSTIATNQNAFGVQNIYVPRGSDIEINNLEGAMNIIEGNPSFGPPQPLNLTQTPTEVFQFLEMLIKSAETISGINSVARGDPASSLKSGTALALVQSMALQFMSGLQQSYVKLVEDVGTALIAILKDFATTPKVIALVGKNNRPLLKEFTGEQVSAINRVIVDVGNPLSRTIAGRVQMAEQLLQMKLLTNPKQYFQIINTGRLDAAYENDMDELLLIKRENEFLMEGQPVLVSPLDAHSQHIMEHRAVLADPELRVDGMLVKGVVDHIQEHLTALRTVDPALLQMIGEVPLPPPAPMMAPMPAGPDGEPLPPQEQPQQMNGPAQAGEQVQGPGQPLPPNGGTTLPAVPTPPPPFEGLPTDPAMMG